MSGAETELAPQEIEASPTTAELIADARAQLLSLEDRVKGQVERYICDAKLGARGQKRPRMALSDFSRSLCEILGQIDAIDQSVRCLFITRLSFLLRVSNNAGALAAELKAEEDVKGAAKGRRANSSSAADRLSVLYEDVKPILKEKSQNKTGQAIFRKLQKNDPKKYPESKRRTVVRHVNNEILRREQYKRELRGSQPRRQKAIDEMWAEIMKDLNATLPPGAVIPESGRR